MRPSSTWNGEAPRTTSARGFSRWIESSTASTPSGVRRVRLVDDADVGHAQVGLARVVAELVARPVRVADDEVQVGLDERRVVVAPVPDDHVGLLLRAGEDGAVVDPGEDEVPLGEVRLVLLALLDRAVGGVEVLVALEALHGLLRQVAVGHRVAQDGDALARLAEQAGDVARRLALARAGAHRADGDDGLVGGDHGRARPEQAVVRPRGHGQRADVHDVLVRDVRVCEDDLVHVLAAHEVGQLLLGKDRDPVRVAGAGQRSGVDASLDVRDLRRREGDHLDLVAPPVHDVEVVEVAAGCTGDDDPPHTVTSSSIRSPTAASSSFAPATWSSSSAAVSR